MKNWKALLGTVVESIGGPQALSFRNLEDWDNLWQVIDELKWGRGHRVYYWECMTSVAYDRGNFVKGDWQGNKVYSGDLSISMEYDLANLNEKNIYIRRSYARRLGTPVELELNLTPGFFIESTGRPYIHYFTDRNGNLSNAYPVIRWLELIDIWSANGNFAPLKK